MAYIVVKSNNQVLFEAPLEALSPLGFSCQITPDIIELLQDQRTGRMLVFNAEIFLDTQESYVCISATASMRAVRKLAQNKHALDTRFEKVETGAYRYISEFITKGVVVSYQHNVTHIRRA